MTTTTETTATRTCPPSDVADMIVPWPDVQPGEAVLWDGEFRCVERIYPMDYGNPAFVLDGDTHNGTIPVGTYATVRRYTEGSTDEDALVLAALDEAADDRIERAKPSGCPECAVLNPGSLCPEHGEHFARAQKYWALRDQLEAGRG